MCGRVHRTAKKCSKTLAIAVHRKPVVLKYANVRQTRIYCVVTFRGSRELGVAFWRVVVNWTQYT